MYGVQLYAVVCVCTVLSQSGLKDLSCTLELVLEAVLLAHPSFCIDAPSQQEINLSYLFLCTVCIVSHPSSVVPLPCSLPGFGILFIVCGEKTQLHLALTHVEEWT